MANDARIVLQQRLRQQLALTPQLRQAIKILQVSRAELETLVDQELIENPVLEENADGTAEEAEGPTADSLAGADTPQPVDGQTAPARSARAGRREDRRGRPARSLLHRPDRLAGICLDLLDRHARRRCRRRQ